MPQVIPAVAAFFTAATTTVLTTIGVSATAAAAAGAAVGGAISALGFASGIGAGLQAWGVVASFATVLSSAKVPKLDSAAQQLQMKAGQNFPVPVCFGDTATGGYNVYLGVWGDNNKTLGMINVLSSGPIEGIIDYYAENWRVNWASASGSADPHTGLKSCASLDPTGGDQFLNNLKQVYRYGNQPEDTDPKTYTGSYGGYYAFPNLDDNTCKLSGLGHVTCVYDYDQKRFPSGLPQSNLWRLKGAKWYDPRKDSTFPGGSGSHRYGDPSTYEWTANPYIIALNFILGRLEGDYSDLESLVRTWGLHADFDDVDIAAFIYGANIADANGWTAHGVFTTDDDKKDIISNLLQAGSGTLIVRGSQISCFVNSPKTSVYTLTRADVCGSVEVTNSPDFKDRVNKIVPYYRVPEQGWEIMAANAVTYSGYVVEDQGTVKSQEIQYSFVQNSVQCAQLARYDLENSREFLEAKVVCMPHLAAYQVGDVITVQLPDFGLGDQPMLIVGCDVDPGTWQVALTLRSETPGKQAYALGQTDVPPQTAHLTTFDPTNTDAPNAGNWQISSTMVSNNDTTGVQIEDSWSYPANNGVVSTLVFDGYDSYGVQGDALGITGDGRCIAFADSSGRIGVMTTDTGEYISELGNLGDTTSDNALGRDFETFFGMEPAPVNTYPAWLVNTDFIIHSAITLGYAVYNYYFMLYQVVQLIDFDGNVVSQSLAYTGKHIRFDHSDLQTKIMAATQTPDGIRILWENGKSHLLPHSNDWFGDNWTGLIDTTVLNGVPNLWNNNSTYYRPSTLETGGAFTTDGRFYAYINAARMRYHRDNPVSDYSFTYNNQLVASLCNSTAYANGVMVSWDLTDSPASANASVVSNYDYMLPDFDDDGLNLDGTYQNTTNLNNAVVYNERFWVTAQHYGEADQPTQTVEGNLVYDGSLLKDGANWETSGLTLLSVSASERYWQVDSGTHGAAGTIPDSTHAYSDYFVVTGGDLYNFQFNIYSSVVGPAGVIKADIEWFSDTDHAVSIGASDPIVFDPGDSAYANGGGLYNGGKWIGRYVYSGVQYGYVDAPENALWGRLRFYTVGLSANNSGDPAHSYDWHMTNFMVKRGEDSSYSDEATNGSAYNVLNVDPKNNQMFMFHKEICGEWNYNSSAYAELTMYEYNPNTSQFRYINRLRHETFAPADQGFSGDNYNNIAKNNPMMLYAPQTGDIYQAYMGTYYLDKRLVSLKFAHYTAPDEGYEYETGTVPAILITGNTTDDILAEKVVFGWRYYGESDWREFGVWKATGGATRVLITDLIQGRRYEIGVSYLRKSGVQTSYQVYGPIRFGTTYVSVASVSGLPTAVLYANPNGSLNTDYISYGGMTLTSTVSNMSDNLNWLQYQVDELYWQSTQFNSYLPITPDPIDLVANTAVTILDTMTSLSGSGKYLVDFDFTVTSSNAVGALLELTNDGNIVKSWRIVLNAGFTEDRNFVAFDSTYGSGTYQATLTLMTDDPGVVANVAMPTLNIVDLAK